MQLRPTVNEVFAQLRGEDLLSPQREERAVAALENHEESLPWYVRALTGAGAWLAAFFAFGFVKFLAPGDDLMLVLGFGALGTALLLRRKRDTPFTNQLTIALALAGEAAVLQVLDGRMDRVDLSLTTIAIELTLIALYPDAVMKFLSTCCAFAAGLQLMDVSVYQHDVAWPVTLALFGALTVLWLRPRLERSVAREHVMPVAYGLSASALFACLLGSEGILHQWNFGPHATALVAVVVAGFGLLMLHEAKANRREWALVLGGVAALSLLFGHPGLLVSAALIAAGSWRRESKLIAMGAAFLLLFGASYYYHLESTLLVKSGSMLGAGALFLALRFYVEKTSPKKAEAA
jgi:hypothetical protein